MLLPYDANQDIVKINVFSDKEIEFTGATGSGVLKDGTGWAINKNIRKIRELHSLGVYMPWGGKMTTYIALLVGNYVCLFLAIIAHLLWRPPSDIFSFDRIAWLKWISEPFISVLIIWILLSLALGIVLFIGGTVIPIPIPFTNRVIHIRMIKIKKVMADPPSACQIKRALHGRDFARLYNIS